MPYPTRQPLGQGSPTSIGVLRYFGAVLYNKRRGVTLNLTYKEIPPE